MHDEQSTAVREHGNDHEQHVHAQHDDAGTESIHCRHEIAGSGQPQATPPRETHQKQARHSGSFQIDHGAGRQPRWRDSPPQQLHRQHGDEEEDMQVVDGQPAGAQGAQHGQRRENHVQHEGAGPQPMLQQHLGHGQLGARPGFGKQFLQSGQGRFRGCHWAAAGHCLIPAGRPPARASQPVD